MKIPQKTLIGFARLPLQILVRGDAALVIGMQVLTWMFPPLRSAGAPQCRRHGSFAVRNARNCVEDPRKADQWQALCQCVNQRLPGISYAQVGLCVGPCLGLAAP